MLRSFVSLSPSLVHALAQHGICKRNRSIMIPLSVAALYERRNKKHSAVIDRRYRMSISRRIHLDCSSATGLFPPGVVGERHGWNNLLFDQLFRS
jgi:hypothetical protein